MPVDENDLGVRVLQLLRGADAGEPSTEDQDPRTFDGGAAPVHIGPPSRSSRWSPTRSEFAIAVSAGFTAPMLGKMLVSTT